MILTVIIILLILACLGYPYFWPGGPTHLVTILLIVILILVLFGAFGHPHAY